MSRFGSSGIRGLANVEVTPELALQVGQVVGELYNSCIIGRDPRTTGPMLAAAFTAGLLSEAGFVSLVAILSGLLAAAALLPARKGGPGRENPPMFVLPERHFVPFPEAEMVSPLIRLRTALRPRTDS